MGKKRKRRSSRGSWLKDNGKYLGLLVVAAVSLSVVVAALAVSATPPSVAGTDTSTSAYTPTPKPVEYTTYKPGALEFTAEVDEPGNVRGALNGQRIRLSYAPKAKLIGVAVWAHGQDGDVNTRVDSPWLQTLVKSGWVVASGDTYGSSWGDSDSVQALTDLAAFATARTGASNTMLIGGSMGGLLTLNALRLEGVKASCWYGTMPVVDLAAAGQTVPGASKQIQAAYPGVPHPAFNPVGETPPLPVAKYRVLASPADTIVPKATNADVLAELVPEGGELTTLEVVGEHGDESHFNTDDLAGFARECA